MGFEGHRCFRDKCSPSYQQDMQTYVIFYNIFFQVLAGLMIIAQGKTINNSWLITATLLLFHVLYQLRIWYIVRKSTIKVGVRRREKQGSGELWFGSYSAQTASGSFSPSLTTVASVHDSGHKCSMQNWKAERDQHLHQQWVLAMLKPKVIMGVGNL